MTDFNIDIRRAREIVATCPSCGMERRLPEEWQEILRASIEDPREAREWDGQLRCRRNHPAAVMAVVLETRS